MTDTRWLDDREQRAWRSLMAMQEGLGEFIERQLRNRCDLSHADFQVLAHLSEAAHGRLRPFELAHLLRWEKGRLSQHLGRMQTRGLVSRERCHDDGRGAVVCMTSRGSELIQAAAPQHVADVRSAVVDQLTPEELATLTAIADRVRDRLNLLGKTQDYRGPSVAEPIRAQVTETRQPGAGVCDVPTVIPQCGHLIPR